MMTEGRRFGRLVTVRLVVPSTKKRRARWEVRCDCGTVKVVGVDKLTRTVSPTVSCGCWRREVSRARMTTHGESGSRNFKRSPTYNSWAAMHARCSNPKAHNFSFYGGRGISVSKEWETFEAFLADMGERPSRSHTIDRFPNVDGNYEPGNVRWASKKEQANNTRRTRVLTVGGVARPLSEWSEITGICRATLSSRLAYGWPDERVVSEPLKKRNAA